MITIPKFSSAIILATAVFVLQITTATASPPNRHEVKSMLVQEALIADVPPALALAVAKVESDFDSRALSKAGARGVMQIMPATAVGEFNVQPDQLWNARKNIRIGVKFLRQLYETYGKRWDLALSHYNAGTLSRRGASPIPHKITMPYIQKVARWRHRYAEQASLWQTAKQQSASENNWSVLQTNSQMQRANSVSSFKVSRVETALPARQSKSALIRSDKDLLRWRQAQVRQTKTQSFSHTSFAKRLLKSRQSLDDFGN